MIQGYIIRTIYLFCHDGEKYLQLHWSVMEGHGTKPEEPDHPRFSLGSAVKDVSLHCSRQDELQYFIHWSRLAHIEGDKANAYLLL